MKTEETKPTIVEGVKDFIETSKERHDAEPSPWWTKVAYVAGPAASGMSFVMTIDGIPKWIKYTLGFLVGVATWYVPARFGTSNKNITHK